MEKTFTGQRILVTRAMPQAQVVKDKLEEKGARPVIFPVIEFTDPISFEPLDRALASIGSFDWILFASANAVSFFIKRLDSQNIPRDCLKRLKIGAIGQSTSNSLLKFGIQASFHPSKFVAESFINEFPDSNDLKNQKVLWPRTNVGRTLIKDEFTKHGASVTMVEAYRSELPGNLEETAIKLFNVCNQRNVDIITVASSQTVKNLATVLKLGMVSYAKSQGFIVNPESIALDSSIKSFLTGIAIASIGPITTATAKEVLGKVDVEAKDHTIDGLIECIHRYFNHSD